MKYITKFSTYEQYELFAATLGHLNTPNISMYVRTIAHTPFTKTTPTVVVPTAKVLTYNGSAQELINAGSTNYGILQYKLGDGEWSTEIPSATNYGSYTVYYKVVGDSDINDVAAASINCSINEKEVTATVELSQTQFTYTGSSITPTVTVKDGDTIINSSEYTVTYSNNINAGTGTVTITDNVGGNYNVIGSQTFTINKAAGSVTTVPVANTLSYTGSAQTVASAGIGTGTMMYRLGDSGSYNSTMPTATNAGTYTLYYYAAESTNYNATNPASITITINQAQKTLCTLYNSSGSVITTITNSSSELTSSLVSSYKSSAYKVIISSDCTSIGTEAFKQFTNLRSITISSNVSTIGTSAFYGCTSLKEIICNRTTPPSLGNSYVFYNVARGGVLITPSAAGQSYNTGTWMSKSDYYLGYQQWYNAVGTFGDIEPTLEWSSSSYTITSDYFSTPTLSKQSEISVTYSSSNTSVATINSQGTVTKGSNGITYIRAIFAGNSTYKPKVATYTLTVSIYSGGSSGGGGGGE